MVLRFISSLFFPAKCPFCSERLMLREREGTYYCVKCQTNFIEEIDEAGEGSLEPHYPASVHQASGTQRSTHFHPLLCQPCNNHQSIILQLLSAYSEEHSNGNSLSSENWEQEYKRYKGELERRYPLCMACRVAVSERLKQQDFRLRSSTSTTRTRRAVAGNNVVRRNKDNGLVVVSLNVLYIAAIYLLEYSSFSDSRIILALSSLLFATIFLFRTTLPILTIVCMAFPYYSHHIPFEIPAEVISISSIIGARCISALSLCTFNLIFRWSTKRPKMRVHKAIPRDDSQLSNFSLSLRDEEDENAQVNHGRNPFLSKSLLSSSNTSAIKSMPTSPLYTNKFASPPTLKPTQLSFKGTATGLENDFLESFSLSENTTNHNNNSIRSRVVVKTPRIEPLVVLDLLMRFGAVYMRFLAMLNTPFQALIFAAAYGLFFNLNSGLHRRLPSMSRYLISLVCALRFVWLGLDIGQPGWSLDLDEKLHFPREYVAFGLDAFLLVFFSPK